MTQQERTSSDKLIITCIEDHPKAVLLLRAARKKAEEHNCLWRAVFIETPNHQEDGLRHRILQLLTIAEQMGGETAHIQARTLEKGLHEVLRNERTRLALVILGYIKTNERKYWFRSAPWMQMVRVAGHYTSVEIIPLAGIPYRQRLLAHFNLHSVKPQHTVYAMMAVGAAYLCARLLQWLLPPALFRINDQNVGLLFMIACAFVAGRFGLLPGLIASLASFFTVNYYFKLPFNEFQINTVTDVLNMILFLSAALLISFFTSRARNYAEKATQRERSTQALFTLYRSASEAHSRNEALTTLQKRLERMLEVDVAFFLPKPGASYIEPACPSDLVLNAIDQSALDACWKEMKTTGIGSPYNPKAGWRFEPMISLTGEVGVLGAKPRRGNHLDAWFGRLLVALADQTAAILQHISLERSMEETRLREEREKLRSMLLSSVSHDFKTPLAGIIGALSVYRSMGKKLSTEKRDELLETAIVEAQRLDNFITNILDMTRIESRNIKFHKEWHSMRTMVEHIDQLMRIRCKRHDLVISPIPNNIEICMDILMTEQVIQNILDNACKYTPDGTRIEVECSIEKNHGFLCKIRDFGPGIPPQDIDKIFDKYTRLQKKDSQIAGTGLGLAIAKAVMEAQGGWVLAENHPKGAVFTLCLPKWRISDYSAHSTVEDKKNATYE